jgi:hypothetical protein
MHQYVIRVDGRLSDDALTAFEGLHIAPQGEQTVLSGYLPDQAALAGALDYLADLGVEIVEVIQVPSPHGDEGDEGDEGGEGGDAGQPSTAMW